MFLCPRVIASRTMLRKTASPSPRVIFPLKSMIVMPLTCRSLAFIVIGMPPSMLDAGVRERRGSHDLPLDLEPDLYSDPKLFDLSVLDPATLFRDREPLHVANRLRRFGDRVFRRFRKAYRRCSYQFGDFMYSRHVLDPPRIRHS